MRLLNPISCKRDFSFVLVLSLLIINFSSLFSQTNRHNIKFNNISIKDGLSQSSPNCIFQDSRGFIWIGTEDGLNKYDGYDFTIYRPKQDNKFSISNPRILSIVEDNYGNLWIGTNGGGLNKYDRNYDRFYAYLPKANDSLSIAGTIVHCILPCSNDELWIGTENGLSLFNVKTNQFTDPQLLYPAISILSGICVNSLVSYNNTTWIGTAQGLFRLDRDKKTLNHFNKRPLDNLSLPGNNVTTLLIDNNRNLVVGTETGLARMDQNTGLFEQLDLSNKSGNSDNFNNIKALLQDKEGNLWIGTFGNGLYVWLVQTESFINFSYDYNNPYSLKNNEVLSLYEDFSGIIWVGTNGIDIYNPKKEKFVLYDYVPYSREKLVFRNIHPIYQDAFGVLWIGSKTDGLHILDRAGKSYTRWMHDPAVINGLSSSRIRAIKEYPEGVLWIGTEDQGVNKVYLDGNRRPIRFKHYKHQPDDPNSITSNKVYAFFTDDSGKLWIGTDNGLTIMDIDAEKFTRYLPDKNDPNSLSNTTVYAIYGDKAGNIWLATDFGINRYDPATGGFIHYIHNETDENSVIHNEILCFHEDSRSNILIGTYGKGLDKFDPVNNKFTHFKDFQKLSTAVIYGILEDEKGNFWMSTNNGILEFKTETGDIKQFSIEDGLQSNEFNGTSYFKSNNGEMFFGGQYGFNSFFPQEVIIDSIPPKIILSDLQVLNVSVVSGDDSPISKHINEAKEITLNHKQNNFTLYFSALHFANPALNNYKYKLEGFDDDWINVGTKRFVSYTNLPYKAYTFRVIASNSDGIWNTEGLTVKIRVRPPFWSTIWFRILMGIILIWGIIYLVHKRVTIAQHQKQLFEEKFEASSKELEEARLQLDNQHAEIVIQKRELLQREKDQESLLWFNQGLGLFSDLISRNREDLTKLCQVIVEKLVEYVEAQQGGVFLLNSEDDENQYLELIASYAHADSRINKQFSIGEGYVGACFMDKKFIEIDNLTENYAALHSGLGKVALKHLVLAPLNINDQCIGVVELGSFRKIKGYRVSFIEKLMETFASTIITEQANIRLKKLIDRSSLQAKELAENEEQLRLNLEEIMATQEESARREDELIKLAEESATREEMQNQEIEILKNQLEKLTGQPSES
jgi:two-component system sensor histidine kinase ChiS